MLAYVPVAFATQDDDGMVQVGGLSAFYLLPLLEFRPWQNDPPHVPLQFAL
jgi:hypothetical protein